MHRAAQPEFAPVDAQPAQPAPPVQRVARWWNRLWFAPSTPGNLGFSRLLFFALMFWFHRDIDYTIWGTLPASFQNANPILLFDLLGIGLPSIKTLAVMQALFKLSLLLACIGLFTRVSCLLALVSGTYVLGIPHTFGKTGHGDGILVLAMLILALSRCGDAWSIDAIVQSWRSGPPMKPRPASGEYTWPIRCMWLLSSLVFLAAGLAKLRLSGFTAWALSSNMANMLLQHRYKSNPPTELGTWLAQYPNLCKGLAAMTIIVEVLFPLAMISRVARWTLVPAMFLMQVGIAVTMGVVFTQFMFIYLFWVPWDWIGRGIQRLASITVKRRAAFFDGGCGFCRKTVAILWHLDVLRRCELFDVVNDWDTIIARFGKLDRNAFLEDMHVITQDGRVYRGYDAYRSIAWAMPLAWPLLPILYLPPVRWIGWKIYRYVATHRHDSGCEVPGATSAPAEPAASRPRPAQPELVEQRSS
jgi:predicted DCC family thiol-disulfide oxidoreductase YuxK